MIQDADEKPGSGALFGDLHAAIGRALDCVGYVTNGSVRDLPGIEALGFHLFAGSLGSRTCTRMSAISESRSRSAV